MANLIKTSHVGSVNCNSLGFSLIELLVTLFLVVMLSATVVSNMSDFYVRYKLTLQVERVAQFLKHARYKALAEHTRIIVCPSTEQKSCSDNWQQTLVAFQDVNNDRQLTIGETIFASLEANDALSINRAVLLFSAIDLAANTTATLTFCAGKNQQYKQALVISNMGRIREEKEREKIKC